MSEPVDTTPSPATAARAERRFRFGVQATAASLVDWQELARKLEDLGYATLVVADHFDDQLAPLPALMAAAAVTTRLRLGTLVLNNDFRHPAAVAKEAATVDLLTNGRLELGLGAGWIPADYRKTGVALDPPAIRLARLVESVQIVRAFFTQDTVTFCGRHYQVDGLDALPKPRQYPHPPMVIGGRQRRMLSFAAREADIVSISNVQPKGPQLAPVASITDKVEWIRGAAGARFAHVELSTNAWDVQVTDDTATALSERAQHRDVDPRSLLQSPGTLVGTVEAIVEQLLRWRETHDLSYFVLRPSAVDDFAPVVARLAGR